jgi:hypothetical protein
VDKSSPVKIGRLDVAQAFWLARTDEDHISRNKIVALNADDVADLYVFPLLVLESRLGGEDLGFARVEFRIGLMSFLDCEYKVSNRIGKWSMERTISSWTSLNAEARSTTAKGAIVVYRFVGETPGICWIHAVNKKNKLAYFENCSVNHISDVCMSKKCMYSPAKNLGTNETILYLLVLTKFEQYCTFIGVLLRAIIRSPINCFSFCHGHFQFFQLVFFTPFSVGVFAPGNAELPLKGGAPAGTCTSSSSKVHPWDIPSTAKLVLDGPEPAGGTAPSLNGSPLSWLCICVDLPT